jgi:1,2-diacylglycerol 3-alpha-glucosyltransferase
MKIAIASSGLGHVARGVESWARDTADALHEQGLDVTLFSGARIDPGPARRVVVPCLRRSSSVSRLLVRLFPGFSWRWGLKDGYGLEQLTFWLNLRKLLDGFDILHVQDPMVALWCRKARLAERVTTREVLAHGTEEPAAFLGQFDYVQHLIPWHLEKVLRELGLNAAPVGWCVAPNFVDTMRFAPVGGGNGVFLAEAQRAQRVEIRRRLGLPEDEFLVGSAGAVKATHKRMDYLIREFASFSSNFDSRLSTFDVSSPHLVIAGARDGETEGVVKEARDLLGARVTFLLDYPSVKMPDFYKALDVFVLPSLFEMMGIVFVEAMASGVPVLAHQHPVLEYVVGEGGLCIDMEGAGVLAGAIRKVESGKSKAEMMSLKAREHVEQVFSKDVVIGKYIEYYERILDDA